MLNFAVCSRLQRICIGISLKKALLILLQPHSEPVIRGVTGHHEWGGDGDIQALNRWDKLVAEFYDIFDPPGMPVERDTMYQIELLPNTEPHYRH